MRLLNTIANAITALSLLTSAVDANSQARRPLNYLAVVENSVIHAPSRRVHAYSSFDLTFDLHRHKQHIRLKLEPNYDILHEDAQITYLDHNGEPARVEKIVREDHKVYHGTSFVVDEDGDSTSVGWARIVVQRDGKLPLYEGAFTVNGDHHHVQLKSNYLTTKHLLDPGLEPSDDEYMVIWRDSDVGRLTHTELRKRAAEPACAADRLDFNTNANHPIFRELLKRSESSWGTATFDQLLGKRQSIDGGGAGNGNGAGANLKNSIGRTDGCPKQRQVALVGIATDCSYQGDFNGNETALKSNVISVVNTASSLYVQTFNITLGLKNLTVQQAECANTAATPWNVACSDSVNMEQRLNLFSAWRGQQGDTNAYWSLFTKCNTGSEVGLAWLGQLCNNRGTTQQAGSSNQTVTGANVVARQSSEWQVFAHETGHTFGAVHDCTSQTCSDSTTVATQQCCPLSADTCDADSKYLMNPFSSDSITTFSPCSVGNICSAMGSGSVTTSCLTDNKDIVTYTGSICGNGIVEDGEECDCGGTQGCGNNPCCNPNTCKFNTNAVCDPSNEGCCTQQCQFNSAGAVCRASTGVCDPAETCSGTSGNCPVDRTADDGTSCGSGLQCASGQCTSRDLQCRTVMGSVLESNDTTACDSSKCTLSCRSPTYGARVCMEMNQNFLDGTPCDGNGRCNNGICQGSDVGGAIKSWIDDNRTLVIALASVIGGLILLGFLCCIWSCCRRRRRGPKMVPAQRYQRAPPPQAQWQPTPQMGQYQNAPPGFRPYGEYGRQQSVRYA